MRARVPRSRVTHERWLISYADFITLLFGLFVVMYAFSRASQEKQRQVAAAIDSGFNTMGAFAARTPPASGARIARAAASAEALAPDRIKSDLEQMRRELSKNLATEIQSRSVSVEMSREGLVIRLHEAGFFASGSAAPQPGAEAALRKIAATLLRSAYNVRVEGHTDNVPMHSAGYDSNWELSSARATNIARLLLAMNAIAPERLSAAGYAEYHPAASNATPEGRAQNRRVDLVVSPTSTVDFSTPQAAHPANAWRKITDGDPH